MHSRIGRKGTRAIVAVTAAAAVTGGVVAGTGVAAAAPGQADVTISFASGPTSNCKGQTLTATVTNLWGDVPARNVVVNMPGQPSKTIAKLEVNQPAFVDFPIANCNLPALAWVTTSTPESSITNNYAIKWPLL